MTIVDLRVVMNVFVHRYVNRVRLWDGNWDMLLYIHGMRLLHRVWYRLLHRIRHGLLHRDSHCFDHRDRHGLGHLDVHRDWLWYRDRHRVRDSNRDGMRHLDADVLDDWHRYRLSDLHRLGNGHGVAISQNAAAMFTGTIVVDNSAFLLVLVWKNLEVFGNADCSQCYNCYRENLQQKYVKTNSLKF
jgi:hypothetical protein